MEVFNGMDGIRCKICSKEVWTDVSIVAFGGRNVWVCIDCYKKYFNYKKPKLMTLNEARLKLNEMFPDDFIKIEHSFYCNKDLIVDENTSCGFFDPEQHCWFYANTFEKCFEQLKQSKINIAQKESEQISEDITPEG